MKRCAAPMLAVLLLLPGGCAAYLDRIPDAPPPLTSPRPVQVEVPRDAAREFVRSREAIYRGDLPAALQHLRAAAAHDEGSPALRTRLAESYLQLGQLDDAIRLCRQALKLDGDYCPAHHLLGRIANYRGDMALGEESLGRALDCDPEIEGAWRDLSYLLRAQGRLEEQLELLDRFESHATDEAWLLRHRGETLRALGRSDAAMAALRAAVEVDPEDAESLAIVLDTYGQEGRLDEAVAFLEDLVFRYPSSLSLREDLARTYAAAGRYDDVITQYMSEYEQDPDNRDLYALRAADWLERLLRFDEAEELLLHAAEEFPGNPMIWLKLGWVRESSEDLEGAVQAWEEVAPSDAYGSVALRERARLLTELGRSAEAVALLRETIDGDDDAGRPPDLEIHVDLVQLHADLGDYPEAQVALEPIRIEDPALHARQLGWLHWKMGELDQAEVILNRAIQGEGVEPQASLLLADIYRREGLFGLGVEVLTASLDRLEAPSAAQMLPVGRYPTVSMREAQIDSYRANVLARLAFLLGLAGDRDRALATMFRVLAMDTDDIRALNFIGYTFAEENRDLATAEEYIRKALTLQPLDPAVLDSLGWVLHRQGRVEEALDVLVQARDRMPDSAVIWHHLGEVLVTLGRDEEAADNLRRCLEVVDEDDPEEMDSAERARQLLQQIEDGGDQ